MHKFMQQGNTSPAPSILAIHGQSREHVLRKCEAGRLFKIDARNLKDENADVLDSLSPSIERHPRIAPFDLLTVSDADRFTNSVPQCLGVVVEHSPHSK